MGAVIAAILVGAATGWWTRSPWAMVLAPVTFMLVFELARMRVDGPTVDGIRLDGLYGVMALVAGRGVDAVLILLPMMVGASHGAALARRRRGPGQVEPRPHLVRRTGLGIATVAVLALLAGLLRPASTTPVVDADGDPIPGSIAELVDVPIGGHDQSIMLRGVSADMPVLLYLEGGPGGTGIGRIRNSGENLEQSFVVATWDQRGTGKSYDALEPAVTLTLDQMVQDTIAVTAYLRERFDEDKIYLVGSSWGTVIGTLAVQRSPELFHAYVGTGQMVDPFATDRLMYAESIADADARGDTGTADTLRAMGPPPYDDTLDYPVAIASNPRWMNFDHGADYHADSEYPMSLFVSEYALIEQLRGMAAIAETYAVLYPQLSEIDFRSQVTRLDVPVYLVQGRHEAAGRGTLADEWFELLSAPRKEYVSFDRSGHTPPYDEPGRFADLMSGVRAATEGEP
ncbi:alpha/beta fold hydrolase [uncultured Phycicoccus sp.]|uniref:alpha/beta fold hydrolase n=1 Tax=uncultured Phycicoccus sp. TaxID=661422 RepID=UPI002601AB13|nr:alpha/beta fold hydrolase [uncultured Phycicoccus sp.]